LDNKSFQAEKSKWAFWFRLQAMSPTANASWAA
jgi:hypothetical protein